MKNTHKPQKITILATALAATLFTVSSSHAAISLLNNELGRGLNTNDGAGNVQADTISYTLRGGNAIAIGFYTDGSSQTLASTSSITLGGQAADFIDNGSENRSRTRVAYWFNPTGDDISVTFGAVNEYAYSIFELSGVDTTVPALFDSSELDGSDLTTTITTTATESFLIDFYGTNANGTAAIDSGPLGGEQSFGVTADPNDDTGTISSAFATVGAGEHTTDWNNIGGSNNDGSAGLAFAAAVVPEPSSSALLGAGFTLLMIRRRR